MEKMLLKEFLYLIDYAINEEEDVLTDEEELELTRTWGHVSSEIDIVDLDHNATAEQIVFRDKKTGHFYAIYPYFDSASGYNHASNLEMEMVQVYPTQKTIYSTISQINRTDNEETSL